MKPISFLAVCLALPLFAACSAHAGVSKKQLKKVLDKNPELVLDVLRENKGVLMSIINEAVQEEHQNARKDAEAAVWREIDQRVKNPYRPVVDDDTRIRGNKDAKYTLVEYSEFYCPYCARGYHNVEALMAKYGKDLRYVFKHKPLPALHPDAPLAAQWMEAIFLQSEKKGWEFHDKLFENQGKLSPAYFEKVAEELGVKMKKAKKALESKRVKERIEADAEEAERFGMSGTPGYLLNGVPLRGAYPVEYFDKIIEKLEKKAAEEKGGKKAAKEKGQKKAAPEKDGK